MRFDHDGEAHDICLDTGCSVTLIDRKFLSHVTTTASIRTSGPVTVNGIAGSEMTYEYVQLDLWFQGLLNGKPATAYIQREARIVNNLKAKLLVGMDILGPEKINLLFTSKKMVINSCKGLVVPITTTSNKGQPVKQNVQTVKKVLIEPHTLSKVPIWLWGTAELPDQTLMFQPEYHSAIQWLAEGDRAIYAHVVDSQTTFVQVRNNSDKLIVLGCHAHLVRCRNRVEIVLVLLN